MYHRFFGKLALSLAVIGCCSAGISAQDSSSIKVSTSNEIVPQNTANNSRLLAEASADDVDKKGELDDQNSSLEDLRIAAEAGSPEAEFLYGKALCETKVDDVPNYKEGALWIRKAAEKGLAKAQYDYGLMRERGQGANISYYEAIKWYRKAAAQGHSEAMNRIGSYYFKGLGASKSYKEALKWYTEAMKNGSTDGKINLAMCYLSGSGVKKDAPKAIEMIEEVAKTNNAVALRTLGYCYHHGNGVEHDIPKAIEYYKKAIHLGDIMAKIDLAIIYRNGLGGVPANYDECFRLLKEAYNEIDSPYAIDKNSLASFQYILARCYIDGIGTPINNEQGLKLLRSAANLELPAAMNDLGVFYATGTHGLKKDVNEAKKWLERAVKAGLKGAQQNLERV